ncbi:MAG: hypothetical protein IBX62_04575 [Coriobacteriia bacterium]|nr:hypothetical protein [Coriobacteriia bacterium]
MSGGAPKERPAGIVAQVSPGLVEAVRERATDGRITCPVLRRLAEERSVPYAVAGAAADEAGVRVKNCELGCF